MGTFWDKTQKFFKSKGWQIFWSIFLIAIFTKLFVDVLHLEMNWSRVILLIIIVIVTIDKAVSLVRTIRSLKKDN